MMKVNAYDLNNVDETDLKFAVISAKYKGKWIFVRHKSRTTWEIPGGHREAGEKINETASRELIEETGAKDFKLYPICIYSVDRDGEESFGQLFYAEVFSLGILPDSEIQGVKLYDKMPENLTYPLIQPFLFKRTLDFLDSKAEGRSCTFNSSSIKNLSCTIAHDKYSTINIDSEASETSSRCMKKDLCVSNMLEMSYKLWEKHKDTWSPMTPDQGRNFILYMIEEIGEAIAIIKKKGEGSIMTETEVRERFIEELGDVLMYYMDVLNRFGITAEEFSQIYVKKFESNMGRDYKRQYERLEV